MVKSCLIIHWRKQQSLAVEHYALKGILIFTVRVDSDRQASMAFDIMDCQRGKMHHSYIIRNREGITAENLCNILKRNDIKKSDAYQSGFLEGTTPMYEAYIQLKKSIDAAII